MPCAISVQSPALVIGPLIALEASGCHAVPEDSRCSGYAPSAAFMVMPCIPCAMACIGIAPIWPVCCSFMVIGAPGAGCDGMGIVIWLPGVDCDGIGIVICPSPVVCDGPGIDPPIGIFI